ncbi:hypothetical protein L917_13533, partial [Phytophthora nicotianae]
GQRFAILAAWMPRLSAKLREHREIISSREVSAIN